MARSKIHDLGAITYGELVWMWRQEREYTQEQAANFFGVCLSYYQRIERDERAMPAGWLTRATAFKGWRPRGARWHLARRRSGLGLRTVAKLSGFSHVGYLALERADDPRVAAFWGKYGFKIYA